MQDILLQTGLSGDDRRELIENLNNALVMNFARRASEMLPEAGMQELARANFKSAEESVAFLQKFLSGEEMKKLLAASFEDVMGRFLGKLG